MAGINSRWTDDQRFLATDEYGHTVATGPEGQGGFKPTNLLLASLVGCAGIDLVKILEKKRQRVTAIEVTADKESDPKSPFPITRIEVEWVIRGHGLKEKAVRDAVELAEGKYCSVASSLKSELVTTVRVLNESE